VAKAESCTACDENASCDSDGQCHCLTGFVGDGTTCTPTTGASISDKMHNSEWIPSDGESNNWLLLKDEIQHLSVPESEVLLWGETKRIYPNSTAKFSVKINLENDSEGGVAIVKTALAAKASTVNKASVIISLKPNAIRIEEKKGKKKKTKTVNKVIKSAKATTEANLEVVVSKKSLQIFLNDDYIGTWKTSIANGPDASRLGLFAKNGVTFTDTSFSTESVVNFETVGCNSGDKLIDSVSTILGQPRHLFGIQSLRQRGCDNEHHSKATDAIVGRSLLQIETATTVTELLVRDSAELSSTALASKIIQATDANLKSFSGMDTFVTKASMSAVDVPEDVEPILVPENTAATTSDVAKIAGISASAGFVAIAAVIAAITYFVKRKKPTPTEETASTSTDDSKSTAASTSELTQGTPSPSTVSKIIEKMNGLSVFSPKNWRGSITMRSPQEVELQNMSRQDTPTNSANAPQ